MRINGIDESFITGNKIRLGEISKMGGNSTLYTYAIPFITGHTSNCNDISALIKY